MKHLFVPDTQVKAGVPTEHLLACANYAVEKKPDVIVMIGDWWDMPSLSMYERKGSKYFHDKSYRSDVDAGNVAMDLFMAPIRAEQARLVRNKAKQWKPRMVFCMGNHEERIKRACHEDPVLEGTIGLEDLNVYDHGWEVFPFLEIAEVDGILYSHFFVNQMSLKKTVLGGTIDNRLQKVGQSFSMGHQQTRLFGSRYTSSGKEQMGLVAGAFYQHDEDYMGPQGNHYWRGIVMKHEVCDGRYDPMFVSNEYLLKKYL